MPKRPAPDRFTTRFDESHDVVVVGFGFGGAVSAIEAHDRGAQVLLVEKMPDPGGISICAGGGLRYGTDVEATYQYVSATNAGKTPDAVVRAFAEGIADLKEYVERLAEPVGGTVEMVYNRKANYPFPGFEKLSFVQVARVEGFDARAEYPHASGKLGLNLFKVLHENIKRRGIEVRLSTPAQRLIVDAAGAVRGLWIEGPDGPRAVEARRGVVLACGGFEAGTALQQQYWQFGEVRSAAFLGNTGDHITMGQDVGASLQHLWHFHGSYGFHHTDPAFPFGIRVKRLPDWTPGVTEPNVTMSWILLDRHGRRFMNEYEPYFQDTGHRALERMDTATQTHAYGPCFLVVDEEGRKQYPLGVVDFNDRSVARYGWSSDNLKEVGNGILKKADSVAELADLLGADESVLQRSLDEWNAACAAGVDTVHGRPGSSMTPVRQAPFYVGEMWPVVSNTQGGLAHDADQRVLNGFGEPIPGLYVAGEAGSLWGHLYLVGGNLAECFVSGRRAAAHAVPALQEV